MDSLTQIVLGAACGEAVLGKKIGNKALLFGALAGTLPDLDVFVGKWIFDNEIQAMAFHRGFMHSILFAILAGFGFGYAVFWMYNRGIRIGTTTRNDWVKLFLISIVTHPILDCFTGYGTQLFSPFSNYRVAFDTIAVADPSYTIPFLVSLIILMFFKRNSNKRVFFLKIGLVISSCYLLFTLINKFYISSVFKSDLEQKNINYNRFKSQPTILNNILWYGVAESDIAYHVAFYSILDQKKAPRKWQCIPKNHHLVSKQHDDIKTLIWFSDGFYSISKTNEKGVFVFKDLRYPLLSEDDPNSSVFKFKINKKNKRWIAQPFYPKEMNRKDVLAFWERLKGI
jgi:inner membrane protein